MPDLDSLRGELRIAYVSLYDHENNALRILAPLTRMQGHKVIEIYFKDWRNNTFVPPSREELDHFLGILKEHDINFVGFSVRATAYHKVGVQLTRLVRERLDIPVIWGGTHTILSPEKCIEEADLLCAGEGEIVMKELFKRLKENEPIEETPGLWIKKDGIIHKNSILQLCDDLDTVPFRDYKSPDKFVIDGKYIHHKDPMVSNPNFLMMCSRGCPFNCAYCYNSTLTKIYKGKGKYYRIRSVSSCMEELKGVRAAFTNLKRIRFDDEVFIFDEEWIDEFCERYPKEVGLPFEIFTEPKLVNRQYVEKLRRAGLEVVYMGIQNSYRVTKELYDRHVGEDLIIEAGKIFHELEIDPRYQVIVDDPISTEEDRRTLFDLLLKMPRPYELYLFSLTVFPNTALAYKLLREGLITEKDLENEADKTFRQLRVSLNYPRPANEQFWASLLVLISKNFIPLGLLKSISKNRFLKRHPWALARFAETANIVKMCGVVFRMILEGEFTFTLLRRWSNIKSLISQ